MSRTRTTTLTSGLPALLMIAQGSVSFACKSSCLELDLSRVEWRPPSASVRRWSDTRVRFKQKNVLPLCEIGDVLSRLVCQLQRCSANFVAIGWLHSLDVIRELVLCVQLVVTLIKTEICEILICIACDRYVQRSLFTLARSCVDSDGEIRLRCARDLHFQQPYIPEFVFGMEHHIQCVLRRSARPSGIDHQCSSES